MEDFLLNIQLYFCCWPVLLVLMTGGVKGCEITFVSNNTDGGCSSFASATVINIRTCLNLCVTSPDCLGVSYNTNTSECIGYPCTSTVVHQGFSFFLKDCQESSTAHDISTATTDVRFATDTFSTSSLYTDYLGGSDSVLSDPSVFTSFTITSSLSHIAYTSVLTTDSKDLHTLPTTSSPGALSSLESLESSTSSSDVTSMPLESSEPSFHATSSSLLTPSELVTISPTTEFLAVSSGIVTSPLSLSVTSSLSSAIPTPPLQALSSCSEVLDNVTHPKGPQVKWEEVQAFRDTMMLGDLFNGVVQSALHCAVRCLESDLCKSFFIRMTSGECCGHSGSSVACSVNMTLSAPGFRYYTLTV